MADRPLDTELEELRKENRELRERLEAIEQRAERADAARKSLMRGGFRVLLPLVDRQKVVRSFGKLAETLSEYSGPPSQWPAREEVLLRARGFMESVVRFMVRRRTLVLLFSLLATAVPALQIWLVARQNEIIENQTGFQKVQLFDVVARSMTEGDRNARTITGALLANADPDFLRNVMAEAFDPSAFALYRREGLQATTRRAQDTGFRGNLIRAAVRAVDKRLEAGDDADTVLAQLRGTFGQILKDTEYRLPEVVCAPAATKGRSTASCSRRWTPTSGRSAPCSRSTGASPVRPAGPSSITRTSARCSPACRSAAPSRTAPSPTPTAW